MAVRTLVAVFVDRDFYSIQTFNDVKEWSCYANSGGAAYLLHDNEGKPIRVSDKEFRNLEFLFRAFEFLSKIDEDISSYPPREELLSLYSQAHSFPKHVTFLESLKILIALELK